MNQNLAQFAQMMGPKFGVTPPNLQPAQAGPPPGAPQMPPGGPQPQGMPPGAQQMPPGMPRPPQGPQQAPGQRRYTPQELAALGRLGDNTVAHLTKGEIAVPPQVQTPKVLATLRKAFESKGANPQSFVAGSPTSSINPSTGVPEYNFWSQMLPIALSVGGGLIGGPLGAAAGGMVGGLATGKSLGDSAISGAMSGIGDYGVGSLLGDGVSSVAGSDVGDAANAFSGQSSPGFLSSYFGGGGSGGAAAANTGSSVDAATAAANSGIDSSSLPSMGMGAANPTAAPLSGGSQSPLSVSSMLRNIPSSPFIDKYSHGGANYGNILGAGLGGYMGNSMTSPPPPGAGLPSNFHQPYTPPGQLPSYQQQLGQTSYNGPTPNFTGYNPATNYTSGYNFFPPRG